VDGESVAASGALGPILGLRVRRGLPLQIARIVASAAGERHDMIDDVTRARTSRVPRRRARMRFAEGVVSGCASWRSLFDVAQPLHLASDRLCTAAG
jgi:hypothetical protein